MGNHHEYGFAVQSSYCNTAGYLILCMVMTRARRAECYVALNVRGEGKMCVTKGFGGAITSCNQHVSRKGRVVMVLRLRQETLTSLIPPHLTVDMKVL